MPSSSCSLSSSTPPGTLLSITSGRYQRYSTCKLLNFTPTKVNVLINEEDGWTTRCLERSSLVPAPSPVPAAVVVPNSTPPSPVTPSRPASKAASSKRSSDRSSPTPRNLATPYNPFIQLCHAAVYLGLLAHDALPLFVHCHHTALAARGGTPPTPASDPVNYILDFIAPPLLLKPHPPLNLPPCRLPSLSRILPPVTPPGPQNVSARRRFAPHWTTPVTKTLTQPSFNGSSFWPVTATRRLRSPKSFHPSLSRYRTYLPLRFHHLLPFLRSLLSSSLHSFSLRLHFIHLPLTPAFRPHSLSAVPCVINPFPRNPFPFPLHSLLARFRQISIACYIFPRNARP